jgi:hypothetical protein
MVPFSGELQVQPFAMAGAAKGKIRLWVVRSKFGDAVLHTVPESELLRELPSNRKRLERRTGS